MDEYITEKMALVGCGNNDCFEIKKICDTFTTIQRDVLDYWYNFGFNHDINTFKMTHIQSAKDLLKNFTKSELACFSAYINAKRNVEKY